MVGLHVPVRHIISINDMSDELVKCCLIPLASDEQSQRGMKACVAAPLLSLPGADLSYPLLGRISLNDSDQQSFGKSRHKIAAVDWQDSMCSIDEFIRLDDRSSQPGDSSL